MGRNCGAAPKDNVANRQWQRTVQQPARTVKAAAVIIHRIRNTRRRLMSMCEVNLTWQVPVEQHSPVN